MKKKAIVLLLVLMMLIGIAPQAAFASEDLSQIGSTTAEFSVNGTIDLIGPKTASISYTMLDDTNIATSYNKSVSTDTENYTTSLPGGSYKLEVTAPGYLKYTQSVVNIVKDTTEESYQLTPGDTNGSDNINILDIAPILMNYGKDTTTENQSCDLTSDGVISSNDISVTIANIGRSAQVVGEVITADDYAVVLGSTVSTQGISYAKVKLGFLDGTIAYYDVNKHYFGSANQFLSGYSVQTEAQALANFTVNYPVGTIVRLKFSNGGFNLSKEKPYIPYKSSKIARDTVTLNGLSYPYNPSSKVFVVATDTNDFLVKSCSEIPTENLLTMSAKIGPDGMLVGAIVSDSAMYENPTDYAVVVGSETDSESYANITLGFLDGSVSTYTVSKFRYYDSVDTDAKAIAAFSSDYPVGTIVKPRIDLNAVDLSLEEQIKPYGGSSITNSVLEVDDTDYNADDNSKIFVISGGEVTVQSLSNIKSSGANLVGAAKFRYPVNNQALLVGSIVNPTNLHLKIGEKFGYIIGDMIYRKNTITNNWYVNVKVVTDTGSFAFDSIDNLPGIDFSLAREYAKVPGFRKGTVFSYNLNPSGKLSLISSTTDPNNYFAPSSSNMPEYPYEGDSPDGWFVANAATSSLGKLFCYGAPGEGLVPPLEKIAGNLPISISCKITSINNSEYNGNMISYLAPGAEYTIPYNAVIYVADGKIRRIFSIATDITAPQTEIQKITGIVLANENLGASIPDRNDDDWFNKQATIEADGSVYDPIYDMYYSPPTAKGKSLINFEYTSPYNETWFKNIMINASIPDEQVGALIDIYCIVEGTDQYGTISNVKVIGKPTLSSDCIIAEADTAHINFYPNSDGSSQTYIKPYIKINAFDGKIYKMNSGDNQRALFSEKLSSSGLTNDQLADLFNDRFFTTGSRTTPYQTADYANIPAYMLANQFGRSSLVTYRFISFDGGTTFAYALSNPGGAGVVTAYNESSNFITISGAPLTTKNLVDFNLTGDIALGDVVVWNISNGKVNVKKADSVTGQITTIHNDKATINGTQYAAAAVPGFSGSGNVETLSSFSGLTTAVATATNTYYLVNGVIFAMKQGGDGVPPQNEYAVIMAMSDGSPGGEWNPDPYFGEIRVKLGFTDGTTGTYTVNKFYRYPGEANDIDSMYCFQDHYGVGTIVRYKLSGAYVDLSTEASTMAGYNAMLYNSSLTIDGISYQSDNNSILFAIQPDGELSVYSMSNVASIDGIDAAAAKVTTNGTVLVGSIVNPYGIHADLGDNTGYLLENARYQYNSETAKWYVTMKLATKDGVKDLTSIDEVSGIDFSGASYSTSVPGFVVTGEDGSRVGNVAVKYKTNSQGKLSIVSSPADEPYAFINMPITQNDPVLGPGVAAGWYATNIGSYTDARVYFYPYDALTGTTFPAQSYLTSMNLSSNFEVVTVLDNQQIGNHIITAAPGESYSEGSYNAMVYVENNQITKICSIEQSNIEYDPTESIAFENQTIQLERYDSLTLTLTILPQTAKQKLSWSSSNPSVATAMNGVVTGVYSGSATITASATDGSGKTATLQVTVVESDLTANDYAVIMALTDGSPGGEWNPDPYFGEIRVKLGFTDGTTGTYTVNKFYRYDDESTDTDSMTNFDQHYGVGTIVRYKLSGIYVDFSAEKSVMASNSASLASSTLTIDGVSYQSDSESLLFVIQNGNLQIKYLSDIYYVDGMNAAAAKSLNAPESLQTLLVGSILDPGYFENATYHNVGYILDDAEYQYDSATGKWYITVKLATKDGVKDLESIVEPIGIDKSGAYGKDVFNLTVYDDNNDRFADVILGYKLNTAGKLVSVASPTFDGLNNDNYWSSALDPQELAADSYDGWYRTNIGSYTDTRINFYTYDVLSGMNVYPSQSYLTGKNLATSYDVVTVSNKDQIGNHIITASAGEDYVANTYNAIVYVENGKISKIFSIEH